MADPYVGEIRMFGGTFAPAGWAYCDGALLPISEYETLFQLIGTTYGGDGQATFALPDLRGRFPMHQGNGYVLAEVIGVETVTLTTPQIPAHSHVPLASAGEALTTNPKDAVWASRTTASYATGATATPMAPAIGLSGGNQPHENMSPFLGLTFIISLFGIFPSPA